MLTLIASLGTAAPTALVGQGLALKIHLQNNVFFEGEPVYVAFELLNRGTDTSWVPQFQLVYQNLQGTLVRGNGAIAPYVGPTADFAPAPGWRGIAVLPGEALFDVIVLQDYWGGPGPSMPNLFLHHLDVGYYELTARFASNRGPIDGEAGLPVPESSVRFEVRPRTPLEGQWFAEVRRIADVAWTPGQRAAYLRDLLTYVSARVGVADTNPYLSFLLHNGLQTARAIGQRPDRDASARIASMRETLISANPASPSAAYTIGALAAESPQRAELLLPRLKAGLASRVAADLRRRKGT